LRYQQLLATTLLALCVPTASAIVPIDLQPDPSQGCSGKVGLGFSGKSGNNDEQDLNVNGLVRLRNGNREWLFVADYNYGESNDERDEDDLTLHVRRIQRDLLAANWDLEGFAQWERDDFQDLSSRELLGGGVRWRHARGDLPKGAFHTTLGGGVFYEEENSESGVGEENGFRINLYGKVVWDRNRAAHPVKAYSLVYIQPLVDDLGDLRSVGRAGMEWNISKDFTVALEMEVKYDREPFPGVDTTDTEYMVRLGYRFD
jgi:putative salt-induced outer membrane protein YdiY